MMSWKRNRLTFLSKEAQRGFTDQFAFVSEAEQGDTHWDDARRALALRADAGPLLRHAGGGTAGTTARGEGRSIDANCSIFNYLVVFGKY